MSDRTTLAIYIPPGGGDAGEDVAWALSRIQAAGGEPVLVQEAVWFARFPGSAGAVRCAAELQRAAERDDRGLTPVRIAAFHAHGAEEHAPLAPEDTETLLGLLDLTEPGGITLGRTVYDSVRNAVRLPYDADAVTRDWHYACAPLRMNKKRIDVVRDSVVHVPARTFREGAADEAAPPGASLLTRAFLLLRRALGSGK